MLICTKSSPQLIIFSTSDWLARTITSPLQAFGPTLVNHPSQLFQTLPQTPCTLLFIDGAPRHRLLQISGRLRLSRSQDRILYLSIQMNLIRLYIAHACAAAGIVSLIDTPLDHLPHIVRHVNQGGRWHSSAVKALLAHPTHPLPHINTATPAQLLVLVQTVEGTKPRHIARRLSCSVASIYQHQARLRHRFGVASNTELIQLFRQAPSVQAMRESS